MATTAIEAAEGAEGGGGADAAAAAAAASAVSGGAEKPFYEAFANEAVKTSPTVQKFKSVEDLASGYVALEKRYGIDPARRIDLPADPADKDGMRAVYAKLGMPEKPDGYGFTLDAKATDADKEFLGRATEALHAAGLPKDMAAGVFEFWSKEAAAAAERDAAAFAARAAEGKASLQKEWGQAYTQRTQEIGRLLDKYADPELKAELDGDKMGNYPGVAKFLGKLLDRMAEPGSLGGDPNEFKAPGALTPSQAKAEASKIEAEPGFRDRNHPQHKALVEKRNKLLQEAQPAT